MIRSSLIFLLTSLVSLTALADTPLMPFYFFHRFNSNNVGMKFAKEVITDELRKGENKNLMVSPTSLYMAMGMAFSGSAGDTQDQFSQRLNFNFSQDRFNSSIREYLDATRMDLRDQDEESSRKNPFIGIYNSAWHTTGATFLTGGRFEFSEYYTETIRGSFDGEVRGIDFSESERAAEEVNSWADEKTEGLISSVIKPDVIKKLTWLLMNATYFEGQWVIPFSNSWKYDRFYPYSEADYKVKMIEQDNTWSFTNDGVAETLKVPFYDQSGNEMAFYIVMPNDQQGFEKMNETEVIWSSAFWQDLRMELNKNENKKYAKLVLPKFTFDYSVEMREDDPLTLGMGLGFLFKDSADFSLMATSESVPTKVGYIKQDTKIELDEFGVKAAAVTTVGGAEATSLPMDPDTTLVVDRPFYFAIVSQNKGDILFVGQVVKP